MKFKQAFTFISAFLLLFLFSSCGIITKQDNPQEEISLPTVTEVKQETKTSKEINEDVVQKKISDLKKKLSLRGLVIRGDIYFNNDQTTLALKQYLDVHRESPEDESVIRKIGDSYFKIHKYKSAYSYYSKIKQSSDLNYNRALLSYIYTKDIGNPDDRRSILSEMETFPFSDDDKLYYTNSFLCLEDFHGCKVAFSEYIKEQEIKKKIRENEQGEKEINIIENPYLKEIETAISNYQAFQVDQVYYKDALIIGAFYKNGFYPMSVALGKQLLIEKPDYKPMLKIIGKSYFDMGDYQESKEYLSQHYNIDKDDSGVTFLLGVINSKLHEYVLSNIYFNKALETGYTPSIDVRRKLIYNYFLLDNTERLLLNFKNLVEEEEVLEAEDLQLAIYYHIIHNRFETAISWSQKGIEIFPEEEMFYGYLGWIYRDQDQIEKAEEKLKIGLEINGKNPMLNLNMGLIQKEKGAKTKALIYFKKAVKENKGGEFGIVAAEELELFKQENNIIE